MPETVVIEPAAPLNLEATITNALHDAEDGLSEPAISREAAEGETPATPAAATTTEEGKPAAEAAVPQTKSEEVDEIAKLLEVEGIKPPVEGVRENRIPYTRVKKITENALKRQTETHAAELKPLNERLTAAEAKAQQFDRLDAIATRDPEQYLRHLALANPAYQRFLTPAKAEEKVAPAAAADATLGPMPTPDATFPDGSTGYSQDGHIKLLEWFEQKAEAKAFAKMDERMKPLLTKHQNDQMVAERLPIVNAAIVKEEKRWGARFTADQAKGWDSAVVKYMNANPGITLAEACIDIFQPQVTAESATSETAMREKLLKEMAERPAAATRIAGGGAKATTDDTPKSMEDTIRGAMVAAGLK